MAGTEFNYVLNLDTSRVMGQIADARSQIGMGLGGGGSGGPGDFTGGISSAFGQMQAGLARPPALSGLMFGSMYGGTFTNPGIAYTPHYGTMQADSQLSQEWLINRYGIGAANLFRPPGVGAGEFGMAMESQYTQRHLQARHDASMAFLSSTASLGGGMIAGSVADMAGSFVGKRLGVGLAETLGVPELGGMMGTVGALGVGTLAYNFAQDVVGKGIQDYYARIEQIGGVTKELGDIAGSGRGLGALQKYNLGVAARGIGSDLRMDTQEVGEILSGARGMGMLPGTTDPDAFRTKGRELASAVDDVASMLHTSLSNAMSMIKSMGQMGMDARGGALQMIGMGASAGISPEAMFGVGMAGASYAKQNLLSGRQGFDLFTSSVVSAAGSGLSREELDLGGGAVGLGQALAAAKIGAATSPMGDLQLMAMTGGGALGDPVQNGMAAMAAMGRGGDMLGNMLHFQTHKRELLRGVGPGGLDLMMRNQIVGQASMFSIGSLEDRELAVGEGMGLNEVQVKAYVAGGRGGGGGGSGNARAAQFMAMQDLDINEAARQAGVSKPSLALADYMSKMDEDPLFHTKAYALAGVSLGSLGGPKGALLGGVVGAGFGFAQDAYAIAADAFADGSGMFDSATDKADARMRYEARQYDTAMTKIRSRYGFVDVDAGLYNSTFSANMSSMQLNGNGMGGAVSGQLAGVVTASGMQSVPMGPGTIQLGDRYFNATSLQRGLAASGGQYEAPVITDKIRAAAHAANMSGALAGLRTAFADDYNLLLGGTADNMDAVGQRVFDETLTVAMASGDPDMIAAAKQGGITNPNSFAFMSYWANGPSGGLLTPLNAGTRAAKGLIGAAAGARGDAENGMLDFFASRISGGDGGLAAEAARKKAYDKYAAGVRSVASNKSWLGAGARLLGLPMGPDDPDDYATWSAKHPAQQDDDTAGQKAFLQTVAQDERWERGLSLYKSDQKAGVALMQQAVNTAQDIPGNEGFSVDLSSRASAFSTTTLLEESKKWSSGIGQITPKGAAAKADLRTRENPIGFGEQESALSSINRSLKLTESMLRTLAGQVDKTPPGSPAAPSSVGK